MLAESCRRLDGDRINRRTLEAMIKSGAMDPFGSSRRALMEQVEDALKGATQQAKAAAAGQNDMFGLSEPVAEETTTTSPTI